MNAVYARQSVDKQGSLSIEGQIELCLRYAGSDAQIFQDRGYSGKNTNRPAFKALLCAVEDGKIDKIFVYRLDRFSRSVADFSCLWEILSRNGVEFNSVTESFDTSSPIGRAMLNIVLVFAQLERETTAERVRDNYIHRFRLGAWAGGPAPYGFDLTKIISGGKSVSSLAANQNAEVVKYVFSEYEKPHSTLRSVAMALNERKINAPKRREWDNVSLSRILHSPLYVRADEEIYLYYLAKGLQIQQDAEAFDGIHACNVIGRRGDVKRQMLTISNHCGFIGSALWLSVQNKLAKNAQLPRANAGKYSWLTGIMKCGRCGYSIKINRNKKNGDLKLICSCRSNLAACDNSIEVVPSELEAYIESRMTDIFSELPPAAEFPQNAALAAEVLETERKIERLVAALSESSEVSAVYISRQIDALHRQRDALLESSGSGCRNTHSISFKDLKFDEKKLVAAEFIEKILLDGKNVNIIWKM